MKPTHAIFIGFGATFVACLIRSALKNYANISL